MDFIQYQQAFLDILDDPQPPAPYNNPDYINYTRLNWSRQERWLKTGILNAELVAALSKINEEQYWTLISEPWCGDAAHTVPFIHRLSELNQLIKVDYQLRDSPPFLIDQYLSNGSKSIPKLVIADKSHKDLAVWGSRPVECQRLFLQLLHDHVEYAEKKIVLQKWYNEDKGQSFQNELLNMINNF